LDQSTFNLHLNAYCSLLVESTSFRRTLSSPYGIGRPSVVCGLSVTLLCPTHRVELFGNISAPSDSLGTWAVCVKILEKKFEGILGDRAS